MPTTSTTRIGVQISFILIAFFVGSISAHAWGVKVRDPRIVTIQAQLIQQIGVDSVITARFEAALSRLSILDQRITSRINKTVDTCTFKTQATRALAGAQTTLSDANAMTLTVDSKVDGALVTKGETILTQSLSEMQASLSLIARCPQYQTSPTPNTR